MRRSAAHLMLALVLFVAVSPAVEALAPCERECELDADDGGCSLDVCCSCCVHQRLDPPCPTSPPALQAAERPLPLAIAGVAPPAPREVAHVPKPLSF